MGQWDLKPRVPHGRAIVGVVVTGLLVAGCGGGGGAERTVAATATVQWENGAWGTVTSDVDAMAYATAVWTGEELVVWGGDDPSSVEFDGGWTGVAYDPATKVWRSIAAAPGGLTEPFMVVAAAAWSGEEVIFWMQSDHRYREIDYDMGGLAYDPVRDRWRRLPPPPFPIRAGATAVWAGGSLVVWGGTARPAAAISPGAVPHDGPSTAGDHMVEIRPLESSNFRDGAAYDPDRNRWREVPSAPRADWNTVAATDDAIVLLQWQPLVLSGQANGGDISAGTDATEVDVPGDTRAAAFDVRTGRWRTLPDPPQAVNGVVSMETLWTGRDLLVTAHRGRLAILDAATERWRVVQRGAADEEWGEWWPWTGEVAVIGHGVPGRGAPSGKWVFEGYDPEVGVWHTIPAPPSAPLGPPSGGLIRAWTGSEFFFVSQGDRGRLALIVYQTEPSRTHR